MPFPIPNILLQSYEEDMKQFSSGSTNNNKFFGDICRPSIKIQNVIPLKRFNAFSFPSSEETDNRKQFRRLHNV